MPTLILNAVSGTGTGNQWIAAFGPTVGDDQISIDNKWSLSGSATAKLSVPFANLTGNLLITSVTLSSYFKQQAGTGATAKLAIYTHSNWYYGNVFDVALTYTTYNYTWTTNPFTSNLWTIDEINALNGGIYFVANPNASTLMADKTYLTIITNNGQLGINNCTLAFR